MLSYRHILNPVFIISLALLIVNDHLLKDWFHNAATGKLSDLTGIVVLTLLLIFMLGEKRKKLIYVLTAAGFVCWKSPLSQPLIDTWNALGFFTVHRVVDYTDLWVLWILLPLYHYPPSEISPGRLTKMARIPLIVVTAFTLGATSMAKPFVPNRIVVDEIVKLHMDVESFHNALHRDGVVFYAVYDSVYIVNRDTFARFNLMHIPLRSDTIYRAAIGIHRKGKKTEVYVDHLDLSDKPEFMMMASYRDIRRLMKKYRVESIRYIKNRKK